MWWIALGLVIIVLVGVVSRSIRRSRGKERGLKAFAKRISANHEFGRGVGRRLQSRVEQLDAAKNLPAPAQEDIPGLIQEVLDPDADTHDVAQIRLRKVVDKAAPQLLDLLTRSPLIWNRDGKGASASAPADRIFYLLWETHPRELGERIGHLWDDPDSGVFTKAIKARASMGRADLAPWLFDLFNDSTHENAHLRREAAIKGTDVAIEGGWIERDLLDALLVWARSNVIDTSQHPKKWAIQLLSRHERESAVALFMSDQVLSLDNNRNLHFVLEAVDNLGIILDSSTARAMVEKSLTAQQWPWTCTFGDAVWALYRTCPDEAIHIAESVIHDDHKRYQALEFLLAARDLSPLYHTTPPDGFALTSDEKGVLNNIGYVVEAIGQIQNGGISQYFFNSSGDNWRHAVTSLRAIGFVQGADAIERAAFIVHSKGAATDRECRIAQYAALSQDQEKTLDELSSHFFGSKSEAAEYRFMVQHLELFHRIKRARVAAGLDT